MTRSRLPVRPDADAAARTTAAGRSALQRAADASPPLRALDALQRLADRSLPAVQRASLEEEEPLQGKLQRAGLCKASAGLEEEEPLQGKLVQRASLEEEEPLQARRTAPQATVQAKGAGTGLPAGLKAGVEALSGVAMDGVRVHYDSAMPAQFAAHAYAQGSDIHLAPGQERHLPHEAWHVVQQGQGRVKPTTAIGGAAVNDDPALESEADTMGARAAAAPTRDPAAG
jgi:hypothetical protein